MEGNNKLTEAEIVSAELESVMPFGITMNEATRCI